MHTRRRLFAQGQSEHALRQAAFAWWPGSVPAGRVSEEPWAFWDFLPTAVDLSGLERPKLLRTDGLSLVSFLKGGGAPKREYFYWELHEGRPQQAVRFGDWKAVRKAPGAELQLFDLGSDRGEQRDLAAAFPEVRQRAEILIRDAHEENPAWPLASWGRKNN
jgi:arylsulfatase A-like enzyme